MLNDWGLNSPMADPGIWAKLSYITSITEYDIAIHSIANRSLHVVK